jgi:hypothetical protein
MGQGGMGSVYRAYDLRLRVPCILLAGDYGLELVVVCFGTEQSPKPRANISIRH